jgi:hypothetical protein
MTRQRIYLPEALRTETSENKILIFMKKYCRPQRHTINAELIQKITKSLAALHTDAPPSFMCKEQQKAEPLSDQKITERLRGWKIVLAEHSGSFHENQLEEIKLLRQAMEDYEEKKFVAKADNITLGQLA